MYRSGFDIRLIWVHRLREGSRDLKRPVCRAAKDRCASRVRPPAPLLYLIHYSMLLPLDHGGGGSETSQDGMRLGNAPPIWWEEPGGGGFMAVWWIGALVAIKDFAVNYSMFPRQGLH